MHDYILILAPGSCSANATAMLVCHYGRPTGRHARGLGAAQQSRPEGQATVTVQLWVNRFTRLRLDTDARNKAQAAAPRLRMVASIACPAHRGAGAEIAPSVSTAAQLTRYSSLIFGRARAFFCDCVSHMLPKSRRANNAFINY